MLQTRQSIKRKDDNSDQLVFFQRPRTFGFHFCSILQEEKYNPFKQTRKWLYFQTKKKVGKGVCH